MSTDHRWVYAVPISDTLHITSKVNMNPVPMVDQSKQEQGMFLQRIDITIGPQRRIIWDSPKALALETTFANKWTGDTVFVHYIPLHSTNGISLIFDYDRLRAIVGHAAALAHHPKSASDKDEATWVHCPLRNGTERSLQIWSIQHQIPKSNAFIVSSPSWKL